LGEGRQLALDIGRLLRPQLRHAGLMIALTFGASEPAVLATEIAALDRAVVHFEIAHVGPVDVAARGIHDDAIRMRSLTLGQDRFQIGALGISPL
jgi:hypothetical protein